MADSLERKFEALFKANYNLLFYRAFDLVEDEEIARDVVSEAFAQLWERFEAMQGEQITAYLYKSVTNRCLDYLRHERVVQMYAQDNQPTELEEEVHSELLEEQLEYLQIVLDKVPAQKRNIFEQCYFENKKYKEVADIMDMNVSTVHKYMAQVYAFLRQEFAKKFKKK